MECLLYRLNRMHGEMCPTCLGTEKCATCGFNSEEQKIRKAYLRKYGLKRDKYSGLYHFEMSNKDRTQFLKEIKTEKAKTAKRKVPGISA